MLYIIECGFADPAREADWNKWYNSTKLDGLLTVPGFLSVQRFRACDDTPAPYMNITSIETPEVFTSPAYGGGGGGRFGDWDPSLILEWTRRLFTGIAEMPAVSEEQRLVTLDTAPDHVPDHILDLDVTFTWLTRFDWETVSNYQQALALDDSVPYRGFAILDAPTAETLPQIPGLRVYTPHLFKAGTTVDLTIRRVSVSAAPFHSLDSLIKLLEEPRAVALFKWSWTT